MSMVFLIICGFSEFCCARDISNGWQKYSFLVFWSTQIL